jgi:peroxiredoxin Q/BCP
MLKIGDKAPEFELEDQEGNTRTLQSFATERLVLYFYPADFTPVCTREACAFRDVLRERPSDISASDVVIAGISPQSRESHMRFAQRYDLPFVLLSDPQKRAIRAYGVDGPLGFGVRRVTFLISAAGNIERRAIADLTVQSHLALVEQVLNESAAP